MPELPEVQTIINDLKIELVDETIYAIVGHREGTIQFHLNKSMEDYGKIQSIDRRGKYIIITTTKCKILIHLRMTGKLLLTKNLQKTTPHNRAEILFNNKKLVFDDIRSFGSICIFDKEQKTGKIESLGLEPFSDEFNPQKLKSIFSRRTAPIKNALINQKIIAGLGNIYACESLYKARISPLTPANALTDAQIDKLNSAIKEVLETAITHGGTTISDYRTPSDKKGKFQDMLSVYKKRQCPQGHEVKKIKQAGRSTYYCPACQK